MDQLKLGLNRTATESLAQDLAACLVELDEIDADARRLLAGLEDARFNWSPGTSRWSIAQCLAHLDIVGRAYITVLDQAMERARAESLFAQAPFHYGFFERWFVRSSEPPAGLRLRTPGPARPSSEYFIEQLPARFFTLQGELRQRLHRADGLDLARVKVASPFVRTLKLGLGPCFQFLTAHERRHLWQAWQVRNCDSFPPARARKPNPQLTPLSARCGILACGWTGPVE